jgi:hypothetical protein
VPETTDRYSLPLLVPGQGQKDLTHNEALLCLDALLHPLVESIGEVTPPDAPQPGQCWIIGSGATGIWAGRDGALAFWTGGGWRFQPVVDGLSIQLRPDGQGMIYRDGAFRPTLPLVAASASIAPPSGGTVVDAEARATLSAILGRLAALGFLD